MKRVAFVVSPNATANAERLQRRCRDHASRHGWASTFLAPAPAPAGQGRELDRELAVFTTAGRAGGDERMVFAVGGDGTVRTCARALAGSEVCLAVAPRGAANLFARALGLPAGLDQALEVGFSGREVKVDLPTADGEVFTAMAGIGIDAAVVGATPQLFKDHLGWLGYALAALPQLNHRPHEMMVRIDGREPVTTRAQSVVVANVGIMPGGFGLFPGARMDDGVLDIGVLFPKSVLGWALMARTVLAKGHFPDRYFAHYRGQSVEVTATEPLPRQVDGDLIAPSSSFTFGLARQALRAKIPRAGTRPHGTGAGQSPE